MRDAYSNLNNTILFTVILTSSALTPLLWIIISLTFLHGFFYAGGINEESGWRGFALPRLQKNYCPLIASAIVWFFRHSGIFPTTSHQIKVYRTYWSTGWSIISSGQSCLSGYITGQRAAYWRPPCSIHP